MPRKDGTGPRGFGAMTGRGLGPCVDENVATPFYRRGRGGRAFGFGRGMGRRGGYGCGFGYGYGRGYGQGFYMDQESDVDRKEMLQERKEFLQRNLEVIDDELEKL